MSRLCNSCLHSNLDVAFYCAKCGTKIFSNSSNKDKPKKEENIDKNRGNKTPTFRWRIVVFIFLVIALFIFLVINKQKVQSPRNYSISEDVKPIEGEEKNTLTNKFSLDVRAIPYDSKIQILNISQPYEKYMMLDKGDYYILVSKKGYKTFYKWITIDGNVYVTAKLELNEKFSLDVRAIPANSKIEILDISQPYYKNMKLEEGDYTIRVSKDGYETFEKTIKLDHHSYVTAKLEKNKKFSLDIRATHSNSKIEILGVVESYYKNMKLNEGDYTIKVSKDGYKTFEKTIKLEHNSYVMAKLELNEKISLDVKVTPSNAKVRILNIKPKYYDGMKLKTGKYHIEVSKKGYETIDKWISLKENENFNFELKKIEKYISQKVIEDHGNSKSNFF